MSLTARELNQLKKIAAVANQMIAKAEANVAAVAVKAAAPAKKTAKKASAKAGARPAGKSAPKAARSAVKEVAPKLAAKGAKKAPVNASSKDGKRTRRTGAELAAFREMLSNERKNGASVAELAKQHGVSAAYIYQL